MAFVRFRSGTTAAQLDLSYGEATVDLTEIDRAFLKQLTSEPWTSTPLFDHEVVARLVELRLAEAISLPSGDTEYRITAEGRAALQTW